MMFFNIFNKPKTDEEIQELREELKKFPDGIRPFDAEEQEEAKRKNEELEEHKELINKGEIELKKDGEEEKVIKNIEIIKDIYTKIKDEFSYYSDLKPEYYQIIALWIIGTYCYNNFPSYPYLFFNAMKGSGKSRTINLLKHLSWNGIILLNCSETSLFRSAGIHTLCFDEFESIGGKDKGIMRELLQAGYKNGGVVERFKQNPKTKEWKAEQFNVYSPKAMANIWGIDDVLADRCITLTLEKSGNKDKTLLIEDFETNKNIQNIKNTLNSCSLCSVVSSRKHIKLWNDYVKNNYTTINNNYTNYIHTLTTHTTLTTLFDKIQGLGINGRDIEIWFPLIIIQNIINPDDLESLFTTIKEIVSTKKEEDLVESRDVSLFRFIAESLYDESNLSNNDFKSMEYITNSFREYLGNAEDWINSKWVGRALKRLSLVVEKVRKGKGIEVKIDFFKAKEKIKLFN